MCITTDKIKIFSSEKNWIETAAVEQLKKMADMPGVVKAIGLPDLHPGKIPVGAAIITEEIIYPHIIGNDIGCGIGLFMTDVNKRKVKMDRWVKRLAEIEPVKKTGVDQEASKFGETLLDSGMGTLGRGNHFAEIQEVLSVIDTEQFTKLGLDKNNLMLMIHSGSRGYGQAILKEYISKHQAQHGLAKNTQVACEYLAEHDKALRWAAINRELIAEQLLAALQVNKVAVKILDIVHNSVTIKNVGGKELIIHRKGAAAADRGPVAIPGSRGALTYLVMPTADSEISGFSLAHGAGRKWERSVCKARLQGKYTKETIKQTKFKGSVICSENNLLFEEAPEAYKNIDIVINELVTAGLVRIIATLRPLLTYKG